MWTHLCASQETPPVYLSGFSNERRENIPEVEKGWTQIRSYQKETEGNGGKINIERRDKKGSQFCDMVFFQNLKDLFPEDIWSGFLAPDTVF